MSARDLAFVTSFKDRGPPVYPRFFGTSGLSTGGEVNC
jgi:hypothetical protein